MYPAAISKTALFTKDDTPSPRSRLTSLWSLSGNQNLVFNSLPGLLQVHHVSLIPVHFHRYQNCMNVFTMKQHDLVRSWVKEFLSLFQKERILILQNCTASGYAWWPHLGAFTNPSTANNTQASNTLQMCKTQMKNTCDPL